ncbi:hypothetical protein [Microcella sp.]|uniref:hypothetical protein n=1 Tax=Microcella sp. TaxID=1913979 RepID=UPI003F6F7913
MGASDAVLQLVCAALVLAVPLGLLTVLPPTRGRRTAAAVAGLVGGAASLTVDALLSAPVDGPGRVLDAALAAAIAASVAALASMRLGSLGGAVFAAIWSILVYQPVFAAVVGSVPSLVQTVFGAVDYAGVLATHVAAAASLIVLHALPVPPREISARPQAVGLRRALIATALVTLGASAWMVGVERVVNAASGRILGNAVVGLLLGALIWTLIERIAGRPGTPSGLVAGTVLAWAAVGLGVAFLSPMALGASVVIGVAGGAAIVVRARAGTDIGRRGAIAVIVATAIGGVILALLADGFGMAATGSTALVAGQLGALLAVCLGAAGSGLLCWAAAVGTIVVHERARGGSAAP